MKSWLRGINGNIDALVKNEKRRTWRRFSSNWQNRHS